MSDMLGNPEDQFSRVASQIIHVKGILTGDEYFV